MQDNKKYISIDVGGSKLHIAILDGEYNILFDRKIILEDKNIKIVLNNTVNIIKELLSESDLKTEDIKIVGISVPSVINMNRDTVIWSPNLEGWENFNIKDYFLSEMNLNIILENDLNAAALGEFEKIYKGKEKNMIFISIGTGIGAGIIIDGKLYRGERNLAGSIGWFINELKEINRKKTKRTSGWLEKNCSGIYFRNISLELETDKNVNKNEYIFPARIFEQFDRGDFEAKEIMGRMLNCLGMTISNIVALMDIKTIVIGGGIGFRLSPYLNYLKVIIENNTQPFIGKEIKLRMSKLKNAALIGVLLSK